MAWARGWAKRPVSRRMTLVVGILTVSGGWLAVASYGAASRTPTHERRRHITFPSPTALACPQTQVAFKRCQAVHAHEVTRLAHQRHEVATASGNPWLSYATTVN